MEKVLIFAGLTTLLFCVLKFIEMKYIDEDIKPLKLFIRDTIMVFSGAFVSGYILLHYDKSISDLFSVITDTPLFVPETTTVFTGEPEF
jgi:hypothetical protein